MAKEKKEKVNPFDKGVTYLDVFECLEGKTIKEYCKNFDLTDEQVEFLEKDFEIFKQTKK